MRRRRIAILRELTSEAMAALLSRPGRIGLTSLGTLLGVASLVAILGIAGTAGNHIVSRFDELAATDVVVTPAKPGSDQAPVTNVIPWDADQRLGRLNGVVAAGLLTPVPLDNVNVTASTVLDPLRIQAQQIPVFAASAGLLSAVRGTIATGRWFDAGHDARADRVVVLGRQAATDLGVTGTARHQAIFIGARPYSVIGIIESVAREPTLQQAVIMPNGTARQDFRLPAPASVHIDTAVGAAALITRQAPLALAPQAPDLLVATRPPEPASTRAKVAGDIQSLFVLLGIVSLIVGALGIANTTLVSVVERTGEIGLRRALGARRRHIAGQFLTEAMFIGFFGGVLGACLGVLAVVAVASIKAWTPVLDLRLTALTPLIGAAIGLIAGAYPAIRAARMEPIKALRG